LESSDGLRTSPDWAKQWRQSTNAVDSESTTEEDLADDLAQSVYDEAIESDFESLNRMSIAIISLCSFVVVLVLFLIAQNTMVRRKSELH